MTLRDFDPSDPATWPIVLSLDQTAAIYGVSRESLRHSLKPSSRRVSGVPLPFLRGPARWRRSDVQRHVEGTRGIDQQKRVAS